MDITQQTYDRIAEDWHRFHSTGDWWIEGTDCFVSKLPKEARVLDVGCGCGAGAQYLSDKGCSVVGIDYSEGMLAGARKNHPDIEFINLEMRQVEWLNQKFDGIFAQASLLHLPKKETPEMIKILFRVLKTGGYFYSAVKNVRDNGIEEEVRSSDDFGYEYQRFFSYYRSEEMRKYFEDAGLKVVWEDQKKTGNCEWVQTIGRKV